MAAVESMQWHEIFGLASELCWPASMLARGLRHHLQIDGPAQIKSLRQAEIVIAWLKSERERRAYQERHRAAWHRSHAAFVK